MRANANANVNASVVNNKDGLILIFAIAFF